jgi:hypothetical protein
MNARAIVAMCGALALLVAPGSPRPAPLADSGPHPIFGPFEHAPLDGPLVVTGSFGEYRPGRFHAGLDYSTGDKVGRPVYAPLDGTIERVRTSGAGYGRSIYLRAEDGRTILLGHLDAFDRPLAAYVAAAQDSSGQYEQDLWPGPDRFTVRAGRRLGWSGQSGGIGQPHLHLEVRRGDMAIHPMLAGAAAADSSTPEIVGIAIEPQDEISRVNRGTAAIRLALGARPETVTVAGFARLEVDAHQRGVRRSDMQPYEIEMAWGDHHLACRFDSLSWATDMGEGDVVYDHGRVFDSRSHAVLMWAPPGYRPRALVTDLPLDQVAGALGTLGAASFERLTITVRDLAGRAARREFVLKSDPGDTLANQAMYHKIPAPRAWEWGLEGFGWLAMADEYLAAGTGGRGFDAETLGAESASGDLRPVGRAIHIGPDWLALRWPLRLRASVPAEHPDRQLGLYVRRDSEWEWLATDPDTTSPATATSTHPREGEAWLVREGAELQRPSWIAHPTHLGRFAFFEDRLAPRVQVLRPPRHRGSVKPYSRWALEARLTEAGSGVDARASYFVVDGKRRPSEWDAVHQLLRWKPIAAPRPGTHRYEIVAADHAGNTARRSGSFVLD